jgi:predicted DNA-binding protein (MmcQ/YjbR family)
MDIEQFRQYCLSLPGTTEGFPFGEEVLVFKVMNKLFALCSVDNFESVNLKCDPDEAVELREQYDAVRPGYHMNKKHWNTVMVHEGLSKKLLLELTRKSYELVVQSLPKKDKMALESGKV